MRKGLLIVLIAVFISLTAFAQGGIKVFNYVLKLEVMELDEDGNNIINFLFVNMKTGEVDAQIKCESDGGRVGRYAGLLEQGIESAGENFVEEFINQIDD